MPVNIYFGPACLLAACQMAVGVKDVQVNSVRYTAVLLCVCIYYQGPKFSQSWLMLLCVRVIGPKLSWCPVLVVLMRSGASLDLRQGLTT